MYPSLDKNSNDDIRSSGDEEEKLTEMPVTSTAESDTPRVPSTMGHKIEDTSCCLSIKNFIKRFPVLDFYLAPITYDIGFSFSCVLYFWVNFGFALGMFILLVTGIATFTPLIVLACVGLPLLYLLAEIVILLTRLCFYMNYYLVETDALLLTSEKWKVKLTLDNKNLPLCHTFCESGNRLNRIKFIVTSCNFYLLIVYHLVINPFLVLTLGLSTMPVLSLIYYVTFLIRYPFNYSWFHNNKECWGNENCDDLPCKCHGFAINNFGKVFLVFIVSLILLPLAFRFCNFCAKLSKIVCYYILTDYYKYEDPEYNPNRSLLSIKNVPKNNEKIVNETNLVQINNTSEIPRNEDLINDHGIKEKNQYDDL